MLRKYRIIESCSNEMNFVDCKLQISQACWRQVKKSAGSMRLKFSRYTILN